MISTTRTAIAGGSLFALLFSLGIGACGGRRSAAPPAAPAPIVVASPIACGPIGVWKMGGPGAETDADVAQGETSDVFVVTERAGTDLGPGAHQRVAFKVNVGAVSAGMATCAMSADCQSMSCGLVGQPPIVFRR